jgi:Uma2 family endonuclease
MTALPAPFLSVGQFARWASDPDAPYDLIDGEPVMQAAASPEHNAIQGNLVTLLNTELRSRPPCRALPEAGIAKSARHHNQRTADVAVTCQPPVRGAPIEPVVVIEILSPSNRAETLAKLPYYGQFETIQEIVFVESERVGLRVYRRADGADWLDRPSEESRDMVALASLGVALTAAEVYRNVPLTEVEP